MDTIFTFQRELYPKPALIKAAYNFTDRAYIHLDCNGSEYLVRLTPKKGFETVDYQEFENEMLAQTVRYEIYQQTRQVREILIARAMATTVVLDNSSDIKTEKNSGIKQQNNAFENQFTESEILKDWFE